MWCFTIPHGIHRLTHTWYTRVYSRKKDIFAPLLLPLSITVTVFLINYLQHPSFFASFHSFHVFYSSCSTPFPITQTISTGPYCICTYDHIRELIKQKWSKWQWGMYLVECVGDGEGMARLTAFYPVAKYNSYCMFFLLSNDFPQLPKDIKNSATTPLLLFFTNCLLFYNAPTVWVLCYVCCVI